MNDDLDVKNLNSQIITFLPLAIDRVISTYNDFVDRELSFDAKEFSNHHSACKSAINHLESLLKILKNTDIPDEGTKETAQTNISLLIAKAKQELNQFEEEKD